MEEREYFEYERRTRIRLILSFVLGILALVILVKFVFEKSQEEINRIIEEQKAARIGLQLDKPQMNGYNTEGELVWRIKAESVEVDEDKDLVTFKGVNAEFYDEGEKAIEVSVDNLIYDRKSRNMEMFGGIDLVTADGLIVDTTKVRWLDFYQRFIFDQGAKIVTKEGNIIKADYIQSNRTLDQMEGVGHVEIYIKEFTDEELIKKHELTEEKVQLEEFKDVIITAEKAIYDRQGQVVVGTSRLYEKPFVITAPDGRPIDVSKFQPEPTPVYFKKKELEIVAYHVEAHIKKKWVTASGNIRGRILPSQPRANEDPALKYMRRQYTYFQSGDLEYFWGEDYARTLSETIVVQKGRVARGGRITYYGKYREPGRPGLQKALFIEGGVSLWQKSGKWMFEENLLEGVKEEELQKILQKEVDISAQRIVVFLNRNDLHAAGMVIARQKDREVKADEVLYYDSEKKFIANGNAYFRDKDGQEFYGDQIIYYSDREDIEVNGQSAARIRIPDKYFKDLDEAIARIKGEKKKGGEAKEDEEGGGINERAEVQPNKTAKAESGSGKNEAISTKK